MAGRDERERERKAQFARRRRSEISNIGPPPKIKKRFADLRDACAADLTLWHTEVFKQTTGIKPFGEAQLDSIKVSKACIISGGRTLKLEPRAYGKSTRGVQEALWAIFYGYRNYAAIFGSAKDKADELIEGIRLELEENETLFQMFPEVCHCFRALEGRGQRAGAQHIDGVPTLVQWKKDKIVFATMPGSLSSGSTIAVKSIRNARGLNRRTKTKGVIRPDLYVLDDIQTDADAISRTSVRTILKVIRKSILRSAGLATTAAVLMLATIIEPDDVPDQLSWDPSWVTVRYKMLLSPAKNENLWLEKYAELRRSYVRGDRASQRAAWKKALTYYKRNRKRMDAGAKVSWQWAYPWNDPDQYTISAIQHAYNILIDDGEEVFASECQNSPLRIEISSDSVKATRAQLSAAVVSIPRGIVPIEATKFVAFIDIHKNVFYWVATSIDTERNARHVVDYSAWPQQSALHFTLRTAKKIIPDLFPKLDMKSAVAAALKQLLTELVAKRYRTMAGVPIGFDHIFFDANWGPTEKRVKKVAREHASTSILTPCHGKGLTAADAPIEAWQPKPGEEKGDGWVRRRQTSKAVRTLTYDTNYWKTETHLAITAPNESAGTLTIFDATPREHELFFDQVLSELENKVTKKRTVHEWTHPRVGADENHYGDCLTGTLVGGDVMAGSRKAAAGTGRTRIRFGS